MSELKPCPFCGSTPSVHPVELGKPNQYTASCDNTKCPAGPFVVETGEGQAVAAWNTRPADAVRVKGEKFLHAVEAYHDAIKLRDDVENSHLWSRELRVMYDAAVKFRAALVVEGK